jgi:hypothetical protein
MVLYFNHSMDYFAASQACLLVFIPKGQMIVELPPDYKRINFKIQQPANIGGLDWDNVQH